MIRNFINIADLGEEGALQTIKRAKEMKVSQFRGHSMDGKCAALIFEKASTRTRVSFEMAVRHLGGDTIFMTTSTSQLGRAEPLKDTARVLSRYVDCLIVRTFGEERLHELMQYGSIPVVNALTDQGHPCQVMADVLTMYERDPDLKSLKVAWIGDGNNMANSWIEAAGIFGFELSLACPDGYMPDRRCIEKALALNSRIHISSNPKEAAKDANYINTDVWASMGMEEEKIAREKAFKGFCVDEELMNLTNDAKFMHCLPAHRGEEVTDGVIEGKNSVVWDEAENRMHVQTAILEWVFGK